MDEHYEERLLPAPDEMERYRQVDPDFPGFFRLYVSKEQAHRQDIEKKEQEHRQRFDSQSAELAKETARRLEMEVDAERRRLDRGQWLAFILALLFLLLGSWLVIEGRNLEGYTVLGLETLMLVGLFLVRERNVVAVLRSLKNARGVAGRDAENDGDPEAPTEDQGED